MLSPLVFNEAISLVVVPIGMGAVLCFSGAGGAKVKPLDHKKHNNGVETIFSAIYSKHRDLEI